ncbi:hypothetical protein GCM10027093_06210 [Paraburkholderia jirisanensis]
MRYPFVALTLAALAMHASAQEAYSAKSLFFSENDAVVAVGTGPQQPDTSVATTPTQTPGVVKVTTHSRKHSPQLGLSYFVRLKNDDGSTQDVLTRRVFRSGEKFQLGVKVSRPSYVYILNQAPDGTITQIYPQPSQDNFVDAMGVVFFPAKGSFQFDDKPGMEKLLVYLSSERVHSDVRQRVRDAAPDLVASPVMQQTAAAGACGAAQQQAAQADPSTQYQYASAGPSPGSDYASKGIGFAPDQPAGSGCAGPYAQADSGAYASKGIVFSDDSAPAAGEQVASYVVKRTTKVDKTLFLKINLAHE